MSWQRSDGWILGLAALCTLAAGWLTAASGLAWPGVAAAAARPPALQALAVPAQTCLVGDDFDTDLPHGWTSQNTSIFEQRPGGPPGSVLYLHAKDGNGASTIDAPARYHGDLISRTGGCGTFCYHVQLFNDGETGSPGMPANFYLYSGSTWAQFLAFQISEPGGPNPGWHRVCAPIRLADGNSLPAGPDGQWRINGETGGGAAVAAWNALVRNVTAVRFPVDWGSSSQNEEVGYDNVCLSAVACPTPTSTTPTLQAYMFTVNPRLAWPRRWSARRRSRAVAAPGSRSRGCLDVGT